MILSWRHKHKFTHICTPDFWEKSKNMNTEENIASTRNNMGQTGWLHVCKRVQIDPFILFCEIFKWTKDLNVRLKILNLIEVKMINRLELIDTGKDSLNRTLKTQALTTNKQLVFNSHEVEKASI